MTVLVLIQENWATELLFQLGHVVEELIIVHVLGKFLNLGPGLLARQSLALNLSNFLDQLSLLECLEIDLLLKILCVLHLVVDDGNPIIYHMYGAVEGGLRLQPLVHVIVVFYTLHWVHLQMTYYLVHFLEVHFLILQFLRGFFVF
jgi:hypothetical protein